MGRSGMGSWMVDRAAGQGVGCSEHCHSGISVSPSLGLPPFGERCWYFSQDNWLISALPVHSNEGKVTFLDFFLYWEAGKALLLLPQSVNDSVAHKSVFDFQKRSILGCRDRNSELDFFLPFYHRNALLSILFFFWIILLLAPISHAGRKSGASWKGM